MSKFHYKIIEEVRRIANRSKFLATTRERLARERQREIDKARWSGQARVSIWEAFTRDSSNSQEEKMAAEGILKKLSSAAKDDKINLLSITHNILFRGLATYLLLWVIRLAHEWIYAHSSSLQVSIVIITFLAIGISLTIQLGVYKTFWSTKPFRAKYDYWMIGAPLAVMLNYLPCSSHLILFAGNWLSDVFDITVFVSFALLVSYIIMLIIRNRKSKSKEYFEIISVIESDTPIESSTDDLFRRSELAVRIAEILSRKGSESLTIGLYGEWGAGKSSMFKMVREVLPEKEVISFEFKPWYFGTDSHDIIRKFLIQFLKEMKDSEGYNSELEKSIREYTRSLSNISLRPPGTIFSAKELFEKMIQDDNTVSLSKLKDSIKKEMIRINKPVVVLIDDIDRLDVAEIQMVFKLVRLVADFPNVTYVLALDEQIVVESLAKQFTVSDAHDIDYSSGRRYLEKFIQIPL